MTIHTPRLLTEAETSLIDAFDAAASGLPGDAAPRRAAIAALKEFGLPTRRVEAFHYTDLRASLGKDFRIAPRPSEEVATTVGGKFPRLVKDASVQHFRDGYYFDRGEALPDGVTVAPEIPAIEQPMSGPADAVALINAAFAQSGVSVTVARGATVEQTIGIAHAHTGATGAIAAMRHRLDVGAGATCNFVDRSCGFDGAGYLHSAVVDLHVGEGASAGYTMSIEEGDTAQRLARLNVHLEENATLNLFILNAGGALVRQELNFEVAGEGVSLNISGVNLIGGNAHIDVTSSIVHHVPSTTATEIFRNVVTDSGSGVFQGQIRVAQAAQLTDARMACNTLLLSDGAEFSAKPELEIFADDVQCAHGATVTDLEEDYLFYLMARGIPEKQARALLVKAFVAEIVEELENEDLVEALEARIDAWMDAHV